MKKVLAFILGLVFVAAVCTAGISETAGNALTDDDLVGEWFATGFVINGTVFDITSYAQKYRLTLSAGGNGSLYVTDGTSEIEVEATWSRNGDEIVVSTNETGPMNAKIESSQIYLDFAGYTYVFEREMHEAAVLPSAVGAESETDFYGTWKLSRVSFNGTMMTLEQLSASGINLEMSVTVSAGSATMELVVSDGYSTQDSTPTFEDGKMVLVNLLDLSTMTFMLADTGEIFMQIVDEDNSLTQFYFTKTPADNE